MTHHDPPDGPLVIEPVGGGRAGEQARAVVAEAEIDSPHGELVDEGERDRLDRLRRLEDDQPATAVDAAWHPFLATVAGHPAGYAGLLVDDVGAGASAELVVSAHHRRHGIGGRLLDVVESTARDRGVERLRIWSRDEDATNRRFASARGYDLHRRLDILGRADDPVPPDAAPEGIDIRPQAPGADDAEIIRVLNSAFPDMQRPWNPERLEVRRELDWYDPAGVFVAAEGDRLLGLHWTKQRGDGVGEVHIMAIADEGQGKGLGRALLRAGLRHLYASGDHEVILWMDAANTPARGLYESEGFAYRYSDAAYARVLDGRNG